MVIKHIETADLCDFDTRTKIMEAATHLFAVKGFDGTSVRDIAQLAGVNLASVNYHFKSKDNLRQEMMGHIVNDFRKNIQGIDWSKSTSDYALAVFNVMTADGAKCVNQFKLFLEAEVNPCSEEDPYPLGQTQSFKHLDQELNPGVPMAERMWMFNIVFSYIVHISVMSSTKMGKEKVEKYFPNKRASIPIYITQLVESLLRDLNTRFPRK